MQQTNRTKKTEERRQQAGKQEGVRVGNFLVIAYRDEEALHTQTQRWLAQGYAVHKTPHFVLASHASSGQTVLLHPFGQADINADLICFFEEEVGPFGVIPSEKAFGAALFALLAAPFPAPRNQRAIWQRFCLNTLSRMRDQLAHPPAPALLASAPYIGPFAAIYQRTFELFSGQSLLDVGCSFGFLPVLLAERAPHVSIVGCDTNPDALAFSTDVAQASGADNVTSTFGNVLSEDFPLLGRFDTVTAIHLLEHLREDELELAMRHLLQVTARRLIIAVPYEESAKDVYGHHQVFTPEKLRKIGTWCVEAQGGNGRSWCEDLMGGLLVVDRAAEEEQAHAFS